ncbi:MAG: hypothetical protein GTN76_05040 [Candidatus Aenigmarchaeota archaeon]|nr:hypothetical protein [Candidatus Aenigmarchaeota archaeon]
MKQLILLIKKYLFLTCLLKGIILVLIMLSTTVHGSDQSFSGINLVSKISSQKRAQIAQKCVDQASKMMVFQKGKLTVKKIRYIPLKIVMEEFGRITGVTVLWEAPEVKKLVSLGFTDHSLDKAVRNILHGESYLLFYTSTQEGEKLTKILILPRAKG